jgi:diaminopropionate ammonia-lyase
MLIANSLPEYRSPLLPEHAELLGAEAAIEAQHFLERREKHTPTPLHILPALAATLGVASIAVKDESHRLGLGSFKALGGSYAVIRLVLEEASRALGRTVGIDELHLPEVLAVARTMTVACATDGNHGRSVAQGAQLVGASAVIFVHSGVSQERIDAIARFGAKVVRVEGTYDDSVEEAARVCAERGWPTVSDTSWPGYERIPGLVMQGYTVMMREALNQMETVPTHVFIQAGVGGVAAAVFGHLTTVLGENRPKFVVVEPALAACIFESVAAGRPVKIPHSKSTIMAMLECYEPSLVAWRILSRVADAFLTVEEADAIDIMNRLARPSGNDPPIVAGESGGVGLAGLVAVTKDAAARKALDLGNRSRVFAVNTEGATDPYRYRQLVGLNPGKVIASRGDMVS